MSNSKSKGHKQWKGIKLLSIFISIFLIYSCQSSSKVDNLELRYQNLSEAFYHLRNDYHSFQRQISSISFDIKQCRDEINMIRQKTDKIAVYPKGGLTVIEGTEGRENFQVRP